MYFFIETQVINTLFVITFFSIYHNLFKDIGTYVCIKF